MGTPPPIALLVDSREPQAGIAFAVPRHGHEKPAVDRDILLQAAQPARQQFPVFREQSQPSRLRERLLELADQRDRSCPQPLRSPASAHFHTIAMISVQPNSDAIRCRRFTVSFPFPASIFLRRAEEISIRWANSATLSPAPSRRSEMLLPTRDSTSPRPL